MKVLEALKRLSVVASMYCDECATTKEDLDRGMFEKDYQAVKTIEKEIKALEVIKVLFQGRCKLYEETVYIETCNEEGCHADKIVTTKYVLEFVNYDLHYKFYLHKEEYDLLKEALL